MNPTQVKQEALGVLLESAKSRKSKPLVSRLRNKLMNFTRPRAPVAKVLTDAACRGQTESDSVQNSRKTKSDKALSKMAKEAEPGHCHTLHEIAEVMGITRERVRQIEQRAKKTFRNRLLIMLKAEGVTPEDLADVLAHASVD